MPRFVPAIAPEIFELRPDYTAISVLAEGVVNRASFPDAERHFTQWMAQPAPPPWAADHLESWRAAYRAFGAKPQRTPCSAEALLARCAKDGQLPAINAVVDLYNAVSTHFVLPVGGENVAAYVGHPRLTRALGTELFDTTKDGQVAQERVPAGEVIWEDGRGVTCRRWNWRQGTRTRIDLMTRQMWFVLERLEPMPLEALDAAASALMRGLEFLSPGAQISAHVIDRTGAREGGRP